MRKEINPILKELQEIKAHALESERLNRVPKIELEKKQILEKLRQRPTDSFIVEYTENKEYFINIGLKIVVDYRYNSMVFIPTEEKK